MPFKDVLKKHYSFTENSVKKYEVGGKVVSKKGASNDAKQGGFFDGLPHSKGGIKVINIDNQQPIEVEGGEVVITKRAVSDNTKKEFEGEMLTNKEILSKINESGGGVTFENGGRIENDEYYISDDDLNFDVDEKVFAEGGVVRELSPQEVRILELINNKNNENEFADLEFLQDILVKKKTPIFAAYTKADLKISLNYLNGNDGKGIYYISMSKGFNGPKKITSYGITLEGKQYLENIGPPMATQVIPESDNFVLDEFQTRVLKLIDNVTSSDGFISYKAIESVFGNQLKTEETFQSLRADDLIINILVSTKSGGKTIKELNYKITSKGKDYLAAQAKQKDSTKVILPENQQRILEIIINSNKSELTYEQIRDKYFDKFSSNIGTAEVVGAVVDAMRELLDSNLITQVSPIRIKKAYKLSPLGFDKIDEIRQSNRDANNQTASINSAPLEIESIRVKINNIQEPNGSKNGIINKYRGPYQKIFENIAVYEDVEEYFQDFGKGVIGRDLNEFYVKIINPKFKIESESAIKEINKLNRVSVTEVIYKNSPSTEGVQVNLSSSNPIFEDYPYFSPDAVKKYNPQVLSVDERQEKILNDFVNFENTISKKKNLIEITSQLIQDVPVENVLERVEMSLLLNAEQEELNLLQNPQANYLIAENNRKLNSKSLSKLINSSNDRQSMLERPRKSNFLNTIYSQYLEYLEFCILNQDSYISQWLKNFFGDWISYSSSEFVSTNKVNNLPSEMSRVGMINFFPKLNNNNNFYVPQMVFQGLSKIYDRVGFEKFPISYYATNYDYADWFATNKGQKFGTKGVILPCILNIRRPLDLSFFGIQKINSIKFFDAVYLQTGLTPQELKVNPAFLSENTPDLETWIYIRSNVEMLKTLKELKICDGIHMFENNPAVDENESDYMTEVWITFYPEQTKILPSLGIITEDYENVDRAWFTKSQFLKSGGKV